MTRNRKRGVEPEAPGALAEPPDFLTPSQREGWVYAVANAPLGILRNIDRGILLVWVVNEDRFRQALLMQATVDQGSALPLLTKAQNGTAIASPYLRVMNQAADLMIRTASELGFTPTSRPRLGAGAGAPGAPTTTPDSPWARLRVLQGGKAS